MRSLLFVVLLALAACGPRALTRLDAVHPRATHSRVAARGVPYGPDPRQRLDVYVPNARGARPRPVVVFFYGGGWASGSRGGYGFAGRGYAAQGFVAVVPDYRLAPRVRFPAFVEDGARRRGRPAAAARGGSGRRAGTAVSWS